MQDSHFGPPVLRKPWINLVEIWHVWLCALSDPTRQILEMGKIYMNRFESIRETESIRFIGSHRWIEWIDSVTLSLKRCFRRLASGYIVTCQWWQSFAEANQSSGTDFCKLQMAASVGFQQSYTIIDTWHCNQYSLRKQRFRLSLYQDCSHCVSFSFCYSTNEQIMNEEAFYYYYMYRALQIYLLTYLLTYFRTYLLRKIRRIS